MDTSMDCGDPRLLEYGSNHGSLGFLVVLAGAGDRAGGIGLTRQWQESTAFA